jgi:hypothetical protein
MGHIIHERGNRSHKGGSLLREGSMTFEGKPTSEEIKTFEVWRSNPANTKRVDQCLNLIYWDITENGGRLMDYESIRNLPDDQKMHVMLKNAIWILEQWGLEKTA